jgi:hypothetical protein
MMDENIVLTCDDPVVAFFDEDGAAVSAVAFSVLCPQPIMKESFYFVLFVMLILVFVKKKKIFFLLPTRSYDCYESQNNLMKQTINR